uniref:[Phe8]-phyllolitorin n=1 Tax=Phyllomedusa sauvagei TaxID=8395 RepID=LITP_PHYSA|nr:RecName: Full=[Phe8]-phyllolitorin; Flags: Precursor [Phyllomedusa sauvagii]AAB32788.1 Phe8 phyllolitorin [Phyllomedusa sauvagii]
MSAVPFTRVLLISGFLAHLLLSTFVTLTVCKEVTEESDDLSKRNVLQRQLWAVGSFMGKKSLENTNRRSDEDMEISALFRGSPLKVKRSD